MEADFTLTSSLNEDLKCGYVNAGARQTMTELPLAAIIRLAAMAVTYYDSPWSDSKRDLLRGVASVLRREADESRHLDEE